MRFPIYSILKRTIRGCLLGLLAGFFWQATALAAATLENIDLDTGPGILRIDLNQRVEFKVLQLDAREILVAFKSTRLIPDEAGSRSGSAPVKRVTAEELPDRVVSLRIETTEDIQEATAEWQNDTTTLLVRVIPYNADAATFISVKRRRFDKEVASKPPDTGGTDAAKEAGVLPQSSPEPSRTPSSDSEPAISIPVALEPEPVVSVVDEPGDGTVASAKEAGLDDFIPELSRGQCAEAPALADALAFCRKNQWEKAFHLLSTGINPAESSPCPADFHYLRAFAAMKMNEEGSDRLYLEAVSYFQDALSYYPNVSYFPYALLAMANIYNKLGSNAEAKGYLNLILKAHGDHPVAAEALFELGSINVKAGEQDTAIKLFQRYLEKYPGSSRRTDVRVAVGKSLYELSEFVDSLDMLNKVLEEDPGRVYQDPDLLITIGNLNYQLGNVDKAREVMVQAVNLYPESGETPVLLTRIGDTLKESGREEEAKKFYELVMAMYPDSDFFVVSAIRCADLFANRSEKEAQYRMVAERFPGHPMSKLAVIRLANMQQQEGEYATAIETLRGIMSGNLKELKDEAEYVMASSFDGLFRQLADAGDPLAVVAAYENDKTMINRFENPDIFERVGTAFLQTNFYNQAETIFQRSYKALPPSARPVSLYYQLAVTLQELGKNMQAMEMFHQYFQNLEKSEKKPEAYLRMGRLLATEESWESALSFIGTGFSQSESDLQKAEFRILQAEVYTGMGRESQVPDLLISAINLMAPAPDVSNGQLSGAHRSLGESYLTLSLFPEAVDAFDMALKFASESRPPALLFLLADANIKAQQHTAAREVLTEIIASGDAFWARMAREQLRTIALGEKLELQGTEMTTDK